MTINESELINICKKNKVRKIMNFNNEYEQNSINQDDNLSERYLYKLYLQSSNSYKLNNENKENDKNDKNDINEKENDKNMPHQFIINFLESYKISTLSFYNNDDNDDSFLKSILILIDNEFISMTKISQEKVLNIVKKELAIKFIEQKFSKELNLRKYKLTKTDIQRILLNNEPFNIIIKQYISLYFNLNIIIANEDNKTITSLYKFKKHNASIILGFKKNIYYPIVINSEPENYIYLSIEIINNYKLISEEDDDIKLDFKYTSKDLNKFKLNDIHLIAKNRDISILDENNKKKVKSILIEEVINSY